MRLRWILAIGLLCCWGATPASAQPVNDDCLSPTPITEGSFTYDTNLATDVGPPFNCGIDAPDVWFEYTTSCTGLATIETTFFSNGNDSVIHVYDACGGLMVACDDDSSPNGFLSLLSFPSTAGTSYLVRLSGWAGGVGNGDFTVSCISGGAEVCNDLGDNDFDGWADCDDSDCVGDPACAGVSSDSCIAAVPIGEGSFAFDTTLATLGGPTFGCGIAAPDVWFEYTSSCNGQARIEATFFSSANDSVCHVYDSCGGTLIACNDDFFTLLSIVEFPTVAGTSYLVRMSGWAGAVGNGTFDVTCFNSGPEICNDGFDNDLDGLTDCADSVDCSIEPVCNESLNCADGIDNDQDFLVDCFDTVDCAGAPNCDESVNCSDFTDNDADGFVDCDDADCFADPACGAPSSDFCLGALPIGEGSFTFDTTTATQGGPFNCGIAAPDVWFQYTSTCNGQATIETTFFSNANDTVIHVYDSCGGSLITCDDDSSPNGFLSLLNFPTVAGTAYLVRLSGWAGGTGTGDFTVSCFNAGPEICDDGFDNDIDGLTDCADSVDCGGVPDCNEALNCGDGIDNDLDFLTDCSDTVDCPTGVAPCIPPANDDCLTATPIACGAVIIGDTVLANPDVAPFCGTSDGFGGGVWYSMVGNGDQVTLTTCSPLTNYDTKIRVYEGDCTTPLCVTGIDDSPCAFSFLMSTVQFLTVPGVNYFILVHGFSGAEGIFELTVSCITPGPENCADAIDNDLDGFLDCLDPDCAGNPLCIENCTDGFDNDTDGFIDCADAECACTAACPTPAAGDECCNAIPITSGANAFSTVGLTTSSDFFDPSQCAATAFGNNENDIWLSWTASITGDATWDTCDAASFDTDVTIYEGSDCLTKVQIACNGDGVGLAGCQIFYSAGTFPVTAGTEYLIRIGAFGFLSGSGTLNISVDCALPVTNLVGSADCLNGSVSLSWDAAAFNSYDIVRDGVTIANIPGASTSYTDLGLANGTYDYDVVGLCAGGGGAISSVTVTVAAYGGEQDLVVRGELPTGVVDSVAALTAELSALGRSFIVWDGGIGDYPCNTAPFEIIWNMNGTNVDPGGGGYRLTVADGAALYAQHLAGAGVYVESNDQWGYAPVLTDYAQIDGVASAADGNDSFTSMDGADSALGLSTLDLQNVAYTLDQPTGLNFIDQLVVAAADTGLSGAAAIWTLDDALGVPYVTGVYGIGLAGGNTIAQSWEFGGFGGNKNDLATRYVAALGGGAGLPQFRRGDTNIDGLLNIADAIYGLGALFPPPGSPPNVLQCRDAGDANDDGLINIADMITILGVLFPAGGGGPTVLPPPYLVCGTDPTSDVEDCANYPTCP